MSDDLETFDREISRLQAEAAAVERAGAEEIEELRGLAREFSRAHAYGYNEAARAANYRFHHRMFELAAMPQTLHFVQIQVNPTDSTKWKVGGVDYGNTDALRNAVQANWEFTSIQGHSTGTTTLTWTVKGTDGYYAPVMVNQLGEMFIIDQSPGNTANADGHQHIRSFGQNVFGIEDTSAKHGGDFDFNDGVIHAYLLH